MPEEVPGRSESLFSIIPREEDLSFFLSRLARFCLGSEEVMLELVAAMKLLLATLRIGVGSARRIFWLVGMALVGGNGFWEPPPITLICDGGIHGARRWILPRIC